MTDDHLLHRASRLWTGLADVPAAFPAPGAASVVVSPNSGLCPPGWVGLLTLGGAVLATAPDARRAELLRAALRSCPEAGWDAELLGAALPVRRMLGPAALAYLAPTDLVPTDLVATDPTPTDPTPAARHPPVRELPSEHQELRALEARVPAAERDEAALGEITSPVFAVVREGRVLAACGYRVWPFETAQFSVLTDPAARGRGLARAAATAAAAHALAAGLLPQWRARVPASRRVAARVGFRELGTQLSVELP
ncbi:putative GNAT family acetyltransferase [Kitasatospora sp. SolWspMP-SS2h]|uniref:GNAT family N-acetyltransferase n=1 Tax=Kitasatospora sp. SolWspMP-SS2h TaxID=1305729 RepID=UPI000DB9FC22|nr:GNAT family N-acetyltransferase [Kitasatospora sp. SolWspMP-SS2h]RAJ46920.1 putative GNAT family acetyltransferase [Kitasatospora sp. SolWspMP-SS2h]